MSTIKSLAVHTLEGRNKEAERRLVGPLWTWHVREPARARCSAAAGVIACGLGTDRSHWSEQGNCHIQSLPPMRSRAHASATYSHTRATDTHAHARAACAANGSNEPREVRHEAGMTVEPQSLGGEQKGGVRRASLTLHDPTREHFERTDCGKEDSVRCLLITVSPEKQFSRLSSMKHGLKRSR